MRGFAVRNSQAPFPVLLLAALTLVLLAPGTAFTLDKSTPLHILPYGKTGVQFVLCDTRVDSRQLDPLGRTAVTTHEGALLHKVMIKSVPVRDLEIGAEILYLLDRYQKQTAANGATSYRYDGEGLADLALQLTWQAADSRKGGNGLILGVELKAPTGDQDRGLGSGSWDLTLRSVASRATPAGIPYLMAFYTATGRGETRGVRTDTGDDLFLAAGLRSRDWRGFGLEARLFQYYLLEGPVRERNGRAATCGTYRIPGYFLEGRFAPSSRLEFALRFEQAYPGNHAMESQGTTYTVDSGVRTRTVLAIKTLW